MCGIVGFHGYASEEVFDRLPCAAQKIIHRGPDNTGIWTNAWLGVAHTRLSIIDLSDQGNQPFSSERHVLAYNGEIYNYLELRAELEREGRRVSGSSDTAVLFALLETHGVSTALKKVRGMFAFVWADLENRQIWLCRDRYGIKPLYYTYCNGVLFWGSEVKALRELVSVRLDPVTTLHAIASTGDASPERTVFENVRQVPPGCFVEQHLGEQPRLHEYYRITEEPDEKLFRELERCGFEDVLVRFEHLISQSTKRMLMSDAPMGAFVSGGVDSSLIAAIANSNGARLGLFTADVLGPHSEIEDARRLAECLKTPLYESKFAPSDLLSTLAEVTWHYECPVVTHSNAAPLLLVARRAHKEGVKAVLTGEGSDELFLGYPGMAASLLKPVARLPVTILEKVYGLFPRMRKFVLGNPGISAVDFAHRASEGFERQRMKRIAHEAYDFLEPKERVWAVWSMNNLQTHLLTLLHRNDRMGMGGSIEARFPYLDEDVVKFGLNLPRKHKIRWILRASDVRHPFLEDKAPVRAAAKRFLPRHLSGKVKRGFPVYGLQYIRPRPAAFEDGWVQAVLGLRVQDIRHMVKCEAPYMVGKMLAVDVFGRLYGCGQSTTAVAEHLMKHCEFYV
jgi:asparagine synthase (glutamine-hydrolysing)